MNKEQQAIVRLRLAAEMSETYYHAPLVITTSGGKDSDVCLALARAAGIRYEVQHNHTSVDAPETVYHVRETFRRLENEGIKCTVNLPMFKGARVTMWSLIPQKLMPPTRVVRYCCSVLKEQGGKGRMITTGVRWAESAKRRKNRGIYEKQSADISRRITISNDNDDTRRLFENCRLQAVPGGSLSLVGIRPTSGRICTHLNGCLRNADTENCLLSGRAGKKCCTGGCRMVCCRGS